MATSSSLASGIQVPPFPIFDGENYDNLYVKMRTLLISHDFWDFVEEGFEEPQNGDTLSNAQKNTLKENRKKYAKALHLIQQGVSNTIFPRIINA